MFWWFKFRCIVLNIFETEGDIGLTIGRQEFGIVLILNTGTMPLAFRQNELETSFVFELS